MIRPLVVAAATVACLSGCGQSTGETTTTVVAPDGNTVTINSSKSWPETMAKVAPLYPGATVVSAFTGETPDEGGIGDFTTSDPPDKVMAFYKKAAADRGMAPKGIMTPDDRIFGAGNASDKFTVSARSEGGLTKVQVTTGKAD
jgi:hypothetical protein